MAMESWNGEKTNTVQSIISISTFYSISVPSSREAHIFLDLNSLSCYGALWAHVGVDNL